MSLPRAGVIGAAGLTVWALWLCSSVPGCKAGAAGGQLAPQASAAVAARKLLHLDQLTPPVAKPTEIPGAAELSEAVRPAVSEGEKLISQGDFAAAKKLLDQAATEAPDSPRIAKDLALACLGLGDRRGAMEHLTRAAAGAGDDMMLHLLIARLQAGEGDARQAIQSLRTALACSAASADNPLAAETMLTLAEMLEAQGYTTAALDCFTKLYEWIGQHGRDYAGRPRLRELVLQGGKLLTRRGSLLVELGQFDQAREVLTRAFQRDRTDDQAARLLMKTLLSLGDYKAAEQFLLNMAAEPTAKLYLPDLAEMLCKTSGDQSMPLRLWQASRTRNVASGDLAVALAQAAETLNAPQAAKEITDSALGKMPNDVTLGCYVAERLLAEGEPFKALMRLAELLDANAEATEPADRILEDMAATIPPQTQIESQLARRAEGETGPDRHVLHYLAGRLAFLHDEPRLAGEQYAAATEAGSTFLPAYEAAVSLHLQHGQYDQAEQLAQRLLEHAKSDETLAYFAYYLEGKCNLARGRVADAAAALEQSYTYDNSFTPTLALMAEVYGRTGQQELAVEALGELTTLMPEDLQANCRLFDQYVAMGQLTQAGAAASKVAQVRRYEVAARAMMAELLLTARRADEGVRLLEELKSRDADDPRVRLLNLRLSVGATGGVVAKRQFDRWLAELGQVLASGQADLPAKRLLAELLGRAGRHDQAAAVLGEMHAANTGLTAVTKAYVVALMLSGQLATAEEVLGISPGLEADLQAHQWQVEILLRLGRPADAAGLLYGWQSASGDKQFQDWCRLQLLNVYESLGEFDKAIALVEQWLSAGVDQKALVTVRAAQIKLLCKAGRFDDAIELVGELTGPQQETLPPLDVARGGMPVEPLRMVLIESLGEAKRYDQAQALLDGWIRQAEAPAEVLGQAKATLFAKAGELDAAVAYARAWVRRRPADLALREAAVAALVEAGQPDRAMVLVDEWLAGLGSAAAPTQPADTSSAASRPAAAASASASAPSSQGSDPFTRSTGPASCRPAPSTSASASAPAAATRPRPRGYGALPAGQEPTKEQLASARSWCRGAALRLLLLQARYEEATRRFDAYVADGGENAELLNLQATALAELGRADDALAALEAAHSLAPDDANLSNNLGYTYADMGINLAQAERLIRQALLAAGEEKDYLDSLGWVLYKQGNLAAAGAVFDRVLEGGKAVWPGCALSYDHAGDVFYRLGWVEKAAELWAKAVALAKRQTTSNKDFRRIVTDAPAKIQAAQTNQSPAVAPLGSQQPNQDAPD